MTRKRNLDEFNSLGDAQLDPANNQKRHHHAGNNGSEPKSFDKIPVMNIYKTSAKIFFQDFVSKRRPCILSCSDQEKDDDDNDNNKIPGCRHLQRSELIPSLRRLAGTKTVQVEKRHSSEEAFGQNRTTTRQEEMTLNAFLDIMTTTSKENAEMFYLSPQQHQQKDSQTSAPAASNVSNIAKSTDLCPNDPFSTPCQELAQENLIPRHLDWAGNLILHQCNLWMGHSNEGSSSGLHNDFHDNFYVLVQGRKRFRLYAPQEALNMYTFGKIHHIHANGLCSYVGHELRSDGVPLSVLTAFEEKEVDRKTDDDENDDSHPNDEGKEKNDDDEEDDDEESGGDVVIGKGFDYQSSEDEKSEDEDMFHQGVDDYDELVAGDECNENEDLAINGSSDEKRPDHFSRIDPKLLHSDQKGVVAKEFPLFSSCQEYVVELEAGQVLYLPASWFHEVTSMNSGDASSVLSSNHIALNYWYYPPDALDNFENPYQDDFWKRMTGKSP